MTRRNHDPKTTQPWALQWASQRTLAATGANTIRWQLLIALAAKRERAER